MLKFRGKRKYGNEVITGYYSAIEGKHYIFNGDNLNSPDWFEIDPTTLAMSTGVTDKNGVEIFGSVPVEGIGMSKGGDMVRMLYTDWPSKNIDDSRTIEQYMFDIGFDAAIAFISPSFYATVPSKYYSDELDLCSLHVGQHGYILITGKQYEHGSE